MNREYLDQYRLNSAALLYRNIFDLADDEATQGLLEGLEVLTCCGVIICPGMSFKLGEFVAPSTFNEKLINHVKDIRKVFIVYNGIIIPLALVNALKDDVDWKPELNGGKPFEKELPDRIIRLSNNIIQSIATLIFGEGVDIYVRPKMIDYIAENDYEWNFDHYTKTLEQISEVIDSIAKRLKLGVDIDDEKR